jgi:maleate isomerase
MEKGDGGPAVNINARDARLSHVRRNPYLDGAKVGLIIPSVNTTTEPEFAWIAPPKISFHAARVFMNVTTPDALRAMNAEVRRAAELLATLSPDVVAYACTAGSFVDGPAATAALLDVVRGVVGCPVVATSTAMVAALRHLGARRVSLATPYPEDVTAAERNFLAASGFDVVSCACLGRSGAGVRPTSFDEIVTLARDVYRADTDAIFVSCTDLRVLEAVDLLERDLGKPVLTSNQVTLWAILDALGHRQPLAGFGRLLSSL